MRTREDDTISVEIDISHNGLGPVDGVAIRAQVQRDLLSGRGLPLPGALQLSRRRRLGRWCLRRLPEGGGRARCFGSRLASAAAGGSGARSADDAYRRSQGKGSVMTAPPHPLCRLPANRRACLLVHRADPP